MKNHWLQRKQSKYPIFVGYAARVIIGNRVVTVADLCFDNRGLDVTDSGMYMDKEGQITATLAPNCPYMSERLNG